MTRRVAMQWTWNEPGPDVCDFCHHPFCVETGFYCAECDRPLCPLCVITVKVECRDVASCPECEPETDR